MADEYSTILDVKLKLKPFVRLRPETTWLSSVLSRSAWRRV